MYLDLLERIFALKLTFEPDLGRAAFPLSGLWFAELC